MSTGQPGRASESPITIKTLAIWAFIIGQTIGVSFFVFQIRADVDRQHSERELLIAKRDLQVNGIEIRLTHVETRQDGFDGAIGEINKKLERLLTLAEQQRAAGK